MYKYSKYKIVMFSHKEWTYISSLKSLTRDEYGHMWKASDDFNGFLSYLPWWALDQRLDKTCLLYQVDSKGQLFLLCIMYVCKIVTSLHSMSIFYKTDKRHARLEIYKIPKYRWGHIGLMSISPIGTD